MDVISFENNSVWADVWGSDLPVEEEEEEGWPDE